MSRKLLQRILAILATGAALLLIAILGVPIFFASGNVAQADVILHFSFDPRMNGDAYAAKLFREGIAREIICAGPQASWDLYPADSSRTHLITLGLPAESISTLHLPIVDCGAEVVPTLIEALKAKGAKSVLLVTDPNATRFGSWRVEQRLAAAGITASTTFAPEDRREMLSGWWRSHWKAQRIVASFMNSSLDLLYAPCR